MTASIDATSPSPFPPFLFIYRILAEAYTYYFSGEHSDLREGEESYDEARLTPRPVATKVVALSRRHRDLPPGARRARPYNK